MTNHTDNKIGYSEKFKTKHSAERYEQVEYSDKSYYHLMWEMEKDFLITLVNQMSHTSINYLDFACGTGRVIEVVENYVSKSTGVDISEEMLSIARRKISRSYLIQRNILKESLKEKFDLITIFRYFLNAEVELRDQVLQEIKSYMTKDSLLIISIHGNKFSFRFFTYIIKRITGKRLNQMSYYDVKTMLNKNGFKIINYVGIGFLPKFLYRFYIFQNILYKIDRKFYESGLLSFFSHILLFGVKLK